MRLKGRHALITGGASGLGYAMGERFAEEGAAVALCDVNEAASKEAATRLSARGARAIGIGGDVTDLESTRRMVEAAVAFLGKLDILVNNAGIETIGSVTTAKYEEWLKQIDVNLNGVFRVSHFAIPVMVRSGGGSIINISSIGALAAVKEYSAYGASKAGVLQLTRSMAADYADQNIRVNCICPGPIDTPMLDRACRRLNPQNPDAVREAYASVTMLKRVGKPIEIANCALFLASDESSYVTGHALVADGGFSAL
jgi:dihydroanticapsin dehydrogenase